MAKFKIGDRVKLDCSKYSQFCDKIGIINVIWHDNFNNFSYNIDFQSPYMANNIPEKWIELVEPEKDKPSKVVYDYRGHDDVLELIKGMMGAVIIVDQKDYCDSMLRDFATSRNIDLRMYVDRSKAHIDKMVEITKHKDDKIKKAFERPIKLSDLPYVTDEKGFIKLPKLDCLGKNEPSRHISFEKFPYYHFALDDDALDAIKYALPPMEYIKRHILGVRTKPQPPKNRIPDRVVFNQDKGKVTVLISKHLDGVAPYWAYTVKTSENDKYDAIFGFMLAYFKYINRSLEPKEQKAIIERVFKMPHTKRFPYLMGVVDQELLKLLGTTKKVEELNLAITSPNADMKYNVTWDYAEWKEMLRVHELETKREHQKEINKQIKAHQLEIDKLKGESK